MMVMLKYDYKKDDKMKNSITDIQKARAVIAVVGELYQKAVIDKLRTLTYYEEQNESERKAQKVIQNIEHEYTLNLANILWKDKYDEIPEYVRSW